jgi:hypothetical protein
MASRRFLCRIGRHDWTLQRSEDDGQPWAYERCRHCDAVRERPWAGGPVPRDGGGFRGDGGGDGGGGDGGGIGTA